MMIARKEEERPIKAAPFTSRGNAPGGELPGQVLITLRNGFGQLCAEYRLVPLQEGMEEPEGQPLVTLHAPGSAEQFALPAGKWVLEVRLWQPTSPTAAVRRRYEPQKLSPGVVYEHVLGRNEEDVLEELRRLAAK